MFAYLSSHVFNDYKLYTILSTPKVMYISIFHLMSVLHMIQKWLKCTISQSSEGQIQMTLHSCGVQWPLLHRRSFSCFESSLTSINIFCWEHFSSFCLDLLGRHLPPRHKYLQTSFLMSEPVTRLRETRRKSNGTNQSVRLSPMTNVALASFHSSEHAWMERSVVNAETPPVTAAENWHAKSQKVPSFVWCYARFRNLRIQYLHLKEGSGGPFNSSL